MSPNDTLVLVLSAWLSQLQGEAAVLAALSQIDARLATIEQKVNRLMSGNATLSTELDTLHQQVSANSDVTQSAVTLLNGFGAKLQDLQAQLAAKGVTEEQQAALRNFTAQFKGQTDSLAQAVAANTVADPASNGGGGTGSGTGSGAGTDTTSGGAGSDTTGGGALSGGSATLGVTSGSVPNPDIRGA